MDIPSIIIVSSLFLAAAVAVAKPAKKVKHPGGQPKVRFTGVPSSGSTLLDPNSASRLNVDDSTVGVLLNIFTARSGL